MDANFWKKRWQERQIGFHQRRINDYLQTYWPTLALSRDASVFVPLCGKSLDMLWLADQGHSVLGIELAEQAIDDFLIENQLDAERHESDRFIAFDLKRMRLLCGDFFQLTPTDTASIAAFYDRAALIALPMEMRQQYVSHLTELMRSGAQGLLIALEYPQHQKDGPPFCVRDEEVRALFERGWTVEWLREDDMLHRNERFREAGVDHLIERVYRLTRR